MDEGMIRNSEICDIIAIVVSVSTDTTIFYRKTMIRCVSSFSCNMSICSIRFFLTIIIFVFKTVGNSG